MKRSRFTEEQIITFKRFAWPSGALGIRCA
jgi:hypothetical protein